MSIPVKDSKPALVDLVIRDATGLVIPGATFDELPSVSMGDDSYGSVAQWSAGEYTRFVFNPSGKNGQVLINVSGVSAGVEISGGIELVIGPGDPASIGVAVTQD